MARNIAIILIGFFVLICSTLLVSTGLDRIAVAAQLDESPSQVIDEPLVHEVLPGENLYSISETYYGDSSRWQIIAAENQISVPQQLKAGSLIRIPNPVTANTGNGEASAPITNAITIGLPVISGEAHRAALQWNTDSGSGSVKALVAESEQGMVLRIYRSTGEGYVEVSNQLLSNTSGTFRYIYTRDDRLCAVWQRGEDAYFTHVYDLTEQGIATLMEVSPEDPISIAYERDRCSN